MSWEWENNTGDGLGIKNGGTENSNEVFFLEMDSRKQQHPECGCGRRMEIGET